jgi:hypothetical protein
MVVGDKYRSFRSQNHDPHVRLGLDSSRWIRLLEYWRREINPLRTAGARLQPLDWFVGMLAEGDKPLGTAGARLQLLD